MSIDATVIIPTLVLSFTLPVIMDPRLARGLRIGLCPIIAVALIYWVKALTVVIEPHKLI
jgi:hypothetical protein